MSGVYVESLKNQALGGVGSDDDGTMEGVRSS